MMKRPVIMKRTVMIVRTVMIKRTWGRISILVMLALCGATVKAQEAGVQEITYHSIDGVDLKLDLYPAMPGAGRAPLIVWVHGGAWRSGSKSNVPIKPLREHGFAIASVDYRLSPVAKFPAQVEDIRKAIVFLRRHAEKYKLDPNRFSIAGASAGGHLAALVGVSAEAEFGRDSGREDYSVDAIVSFYGASNLETILSQSTPHGLSVRVPALELLLGSQPEKQPKLAQLASPVHHVDPTDPPLLLLHGDQDPQMPINQAHELDGKYKALGLDATFIVVHGAAHGGKEFYSDKQLKGVAQFLKERLRD